MCVPEVYIVRRALSSCSICLFFTLSSSFCLASFLCNTLRKSSSNLSSLFLISMSQVHLNQLLVITRESILQLTSSPDTLSLSVNATLPSALSFSSGTDRLFLLPSLVSSPTLKRCAYASLPSLMTLVFDGRRTGSFLVFFLSPCIVFFVPFYGTFFFSSEYKHKTW